MPKGRPTTPGDDLDRFMSKTREDESGCLIWTGQTEKRMGYGKFKAQGRWHMAHRWIYQFMTGDYESEAVLHACDTPACVHWLKCLSGGTRADNVRDMVRKGRHAHGETHGRYVHGRKVKCKWPNMS